jgi:DNA sulfur modification protein DndE
VENIFVDGIQMRGIANEAILFDMFYGGGAPEDEAAKGMDEVKAEPVNDRTPRFRNFTIRNVVCNGARRALLIHGLPEMPVSNVTIDHAYIAAQQVVLCRDADGISIADATIALDGSPVVGLTQCKNITISRLSYSGSVPVFLQADGAVTHGIRIVDVDLSKATKGISLGKEVSADAVSTK